MLEEQITFRINPHMKAAIAELVAHGAYRSTSAFMQEAVRLKLQLDGIAVKEEWPGPDPIAAYFESWRGRTLLRRLIREELGD